MEQYLKERAEKIEAFTKAQCVAYLILTSRYTNAERPMLMKKSLSELRNWAHRASVMDLGEGAR